MEKGDASRVAVKGEAKRKKKASRSKKTKRKYKALEEGKALDVVENEGQDGVDEDGVGDEEYEEDGDMADHSERLGQVKGIMGRHKKPPNPPRI